MYLFMYYTAVPGPRNVKFKFLASFFSFSLRINKRNGGKVEKYKFFAFPFQMRTSIYGRSWKSLDNTDVALNNLLFMARTNNNYAKQCRWCMRWLFEKFEMQRFCWVRFELTHDTNGWRTSWSLSFHGLCVCDTVVSVWCTASDGLSSDDQNQFELSDKQSQDTISHRVWWSHCVL